MEFQAEAVWAQWQHCTMLPDVDQRLQEAMEDAGGGTAQQRRRVVDTHYLGDAQWDYCRDMARLAGLYHDTTSSTSAALPVATEVSTEAYIRMNKALYDYVGRYRKSLLPGGPDLYRNLIFTRYPTQDKFEVEMMMDPSAMINVDENNNVDETPSNSAAAVASSIRQQPMNRTIITI
jgi:hypothetical protein